MAKEYTKDQIWKLIEKLPKELKEAVFSTETADNILDACMKGGVEDERVSEVARFTGRVLMGILPPDEFQETLEKEVKLSKDSAKEIAREINRFIFYPVKPELEELYKMEIIPPAKPVEKAEVKEREIKKEKPSTPSKKDIYREPIE